MKWLLITLAALTLTACDYDEIEREIGYKGKARVNPWLAAERFSQQMGYHTKTLFTWNAPKWEDGVCILPAEVLGNESYIHQTEKWVRKGGHLILLLENANAETNDWGGRGVKPDLEPAFDAMMERLGIKLLESDSVSAKKIQFSGKSYHVEAKSSYSVQSRKDRKAGVFTSVPMGNGRVSILTDAKIFRNRWIGDHEHAALFDALLRVTGYDGTVVFMRGNGLSLWGMLTQYMWPVLFALVVWIVLWLWKNLSRFGPVDTSKEEEELRGFGHHLEALGSFQWRVDRAASLLEPLRNQIMELGQRESARMGRRDEDLFVFLADRTGLTRERVLRAMAEAKPADTSVLIRSTADLQQLLQSLDPSTLKS